MAEEKAAAESPAAAAPATGGQKPLLFIILAIVNMIIVLVVGIFLYLGKKKEAARPTVDNVIAGEKETSDKEASEKKDFVGKVVPMETFIVNLAGSKGRRVAKVNMELELKETEEEGKVAPRVINLSGKNTTPMGRGDRIIIRTPGGGGWGSKDDRTSKDARDPINARNASARMVPLLNDESAPTGVIAPSKEDADNNSTHQVKLSAHHTTRTKGSMAEWSALQLGA